MIGDVETLYAILLALVLGVGWEGEFRLTSPCVKKGRIQEFRILPQSNRQVTAL